MRVKATDTRLAVESGSSKLFPDLPGNRYACRMFIMAERSADWLRQADADLEHVAMR